MSRFARALARANRVFGEQLSDGEAAYETRDGEVIEGVPYVLDLDFEVLTEDQLAARIKTVLVPVSRVPESRYDDRLVTDERTWTCARTLEDDGQWRRIEVI